MNAHLKEINNKDEVVYDVCKTQNYFLIGRKKLCDLVIKVDQISRFNGFIAIHPTEDCLYLFSTSRNQNLFYNPHIPNFNCKSSIVVSSLDVLQSAKSSLTPEELKKKRVEKKMDNMDFFTPGEFKKIEDIKPLLDKLTDSEYFDVCIQSGAIRLENKGYIGIKTSKSTKLVYQLTIETQKERTGLTFTDLSFH